MVEKIARKSKVSVRKKNGLIHDVTYTFPEVQLPLPAMMFSCHGTMSSSICSKGVPTSNFATPLKVQIHVDK